MQTQPKQLNIIDDLDNIPQWSNNFGVTHFRYRKGVLECKSGFGEWEAFEGSSPEFEIKSPSKVMDLYKRDNPVKKPSPGIKPQSPPKSRGGSNY